MPSKRSAPNDGQQNGNKRSRASNGSPAAAGPPDRSEIQKTIAEAKARAAAKAAELSKARAASKQVSSPAAGSPSPAPGAGGGAMAMIADIRARMAAAQTSKSPAPSKTPAQSQLPPPPPRDDGPDMARGGLATGLHPLLMKDAGSKAKQNNLATTLGNKRAESPEQDANEKKQLDLSGPNMEELKNNPYYDPNLTQPPPSRHSRKLNFNQQGKYIAQAAALRQRSNLEELKKRIAQSQRKDGLDDDSEKNFLVQAPPDVEWWDEGLVVDKSYDSEWKIDTEDTLITQYIQHPPLMKAPQDKLATEPKALPLTKKETKKLRRQRRMEDHKEEQAKIRLGLVPPPPPKVKRSNLMRVLGEQAVKDPTAVEREVMRQIQERKETHERTNAERALTKEQKHEKLEANQIKDAEKGIYVTVFRVENLSYGKHRALIDMNAKQRAITGICIVNPKFNLVIAEGGIHSVQSYKKLMLNRIKWQDNAAPSSVREGNREIEQAWLKNMDDDGTLKDFSGNKCTMVWEGMEKNRSYTKWLGMKICETEVDAKETLERAKMENMWTLAKSLGQILD